MGMTRKGSLVQVLYGPPLFEIRGPSPRVAVISSGDYCTWRFALDRRLGPWSFAWHFLPPSLTLSPVCVSD
jgi:hypothetical protein